MVAAVRYSLWIARHENTNLTWSRVAIWNIANWGFALGPAQQAVSED